MNSGLRTTQNIEIWTENGERIHPAVDRSRQIAIVKLITN